MSDLLVDMLDQARRRGATAADAFVVEDQSFSAQVRLGRVDTVKHAREQHLALRVFVGQSVAAASSSDLSPESVSRLVDEAVSLAKRYDKRLIRFRRFADITNLCSSR